MEVWLVGSFSITLMKMVVIASTLVRFTVRAASTNNGFKKVVAKVIIMRRKGGRMAYWSSSSPS